MYIVPHNAPAISAAATPRIASFAGTWAADAAASTVPPTNISSAPPITPSQRRRSAPRSSPKNRTPQMIPSRLLLFHNGKAMLSPTSRTAKIVRVLATAHRHPARIAHTIRCGACLRSAAIYDVPCISAGIVHRARNTPMTMLNEITTGESPSVTNFVGASAAPSHAPAVTPQSIPTPCSVRRRTASRAARGVLSRDSSGSAVLTKSSAERAAPRRARPRAPRTAHRAARGPPTRPTYLRRRRPCIHPTVGGYTGEYWRLGARETSFQSHLFDGGFRDHKRRMAEDRRFFSRLGAGPFVARNQFARPPSRAPRQTANWFSSFSLGAARAHSHHSARPARLRAESGLRGKARVAEGLLAAESRSRQREVVERKCCCLAQRPHGTRAFHHQQ